MKLPNEKERLTIYRKALRSMKKKGPVRYLCVAIALAIKSDFQELNSEWYINDYYDLLQHFPEVNRQKPVDAGWSWFNIDDTQPRITILQNAIEELKTKLKS